MKTFRKSQKNTKRIAGICLLLCAVLLTMAGCTGGGSKSLSMEDVVKTTAEKLMADNPNPTIAAIGGDWVIRGLALSGTAIPEEYYDHYYDNVRAEVKKKQGVISENRYTDYSRVILSLASIGKNPSDVEGYDLTVYLDDYDKISAQGSTSAAFALIAANAAGVHLENEERYIQLILNKEGESLAMGEDGLSDYYAMGAEGLSFYRGRADVDAYIEEAVQFLSQAQTETGAMNNCEATAECLEALNQLGIDAVSDERFVKNGKTLYDGLMTFYLGDGTFAHESTEEGANPMACERALLGMDAVTLYQKGMKMYEQK